MKVLFAGTAIQTNDDGAGFIAGGIWYRFSVEEAFKGVASGIKELIVNPASGTSCQTSFTIGKRYLISSYGDSLADQNSPAISVGGFPSVGGQRPPGPVVTTGGCSGSTELEHATDDLAYARLANSGTPVTRIFGAIGIHAENFGAGEFAPLENAEVRVRGEGRERFTTSDKKGHYEVQGILPGDYRVSVAAPGFTSRRDTYNVTLAKNGCAEANIGMFSDGGLSGKVLKKDGSPAQNVSVEYVMNDGSFRWQAFRERATKTNANGEFHFTAVPPGDWVVGVHINSAPTVEEGILPHYFPGVASRGKAEVIHIALNQKKTDLVIKLGSTPIVRPVKMRLQWPDGKSGGTTSIWASVNESLSERVKTNDSGVAEMQLFEGIEYEFKARVWTTYRMVNGNRLGENWVDATATANIGSDSREIVMVLNKPKPTR